MDLLLCFHFYRAVLGASVRHMYLFLVFDFRWLNTLRWNIKWAVLTHAFFPLRSQNDLFTWMPVFSSPSSSFLLFFVNFSSKNHRNSPFINSYCCWSCCCFFRWVLCTDVKPCELIITLSPNNFTTFQKGKKCTQTHAHTRVDINKKNIYKHLPAYKYHSVCRVEEKEEEEKTLWKLLVIEKLVGMILQHCLC